jgi:hypothetical protein
VELILPSASNDELKNVKAIGNGNKSKDAETFVFEVDHMEIFSQNNVAWPPTSADYARWDLAEAVKELPRRSAECVYYNRLLLHPCDDRESFVDLAKTLSWQLGSTKRAPLFCLASSSRPWLLRAARPMAGVEAMMFQGWGLSDIKLTVEPGNRLPQPVVLAMAGNAMNGFVLADLLISILACTNWSRLAASYDEWCRPFQCADDHPAIAHDTAENTGPAVTVDLCSSSEHADMSDDDELSSDSDA